MKMQNKVRRLRLLLPLALLVIARPQPSHARATGLRGPAAGVRMGLEVAGDDGVPPSPMYSNSDLAPKLTDCLLSAVSSEDCGTVVPGCHWCAEPIYGLCVTEEAAMRLKIVPFFKCSASETTAIME